MNLASVKRVWNRRPDKVMPFQSTRVLHSFDKRLDNRAMFGLASGQSTKEDVNDIGSQLEDRNVVDLVYKYSAKNHAGL